MARINANVGGAAPATSVIGARDAQLGYIFDILYPAMVAHKQQTGETLKFADAPAPAADIVPMKTDESSGLKVPLTNAKGEPLPPARAIFQRVVARYRPSDTNKNGNLVIWNKVRALAKKMSKASGVSRGRGSSFEPLPQAEVDKLAALEVGDNT